MALLYVQYLLRKGCFLVIKYYVNEATEKSNILSLEISGLSEPIDARFLVGHVATTIWRQSVHSDLRSRVTKYYQKRNSIHSEFQPHGDAEHPTGPPIGKV